MVNRIPWLVAAALLSGCGFGVDLGAPQDQVNPATPGAGQIDGGMATPTKPPTATCASRPATPTVVSNIRDFLPDAVSTTYAGLAIDGGWVYFGAGQGGISHPYSVIYRVPTGGGQAEVVVSEASEMFIGGRIFVRNGKLAFQEGKAVSTGVASWAFLYPNIRVWDVASGTSQKLANPRDLKHTTLHAMDASGSLYWTAWGGPELPGTSLVPHVVARWDGATVSELALGTNFAEVVVDDTSVYYRSIDSSSTIMSVPKLGGVPTMLAELQTYPGLLATDANNLYLRPDQIGDEVVSMKKAGGTFSPVITMKATSSFNPSLVGDTFYWVESAALFRAKATAGVPEKLASSENQWITAVGTDTCNVYWLAENPPQVMARAR